MAVLSDQVLLNQMAAQAFEPFNNFLAARLGMAQRAANERFVLSRDEAIDRRAAGRRKDEETFLLSRDKARDQETFLRAEEEALRVAERDEEVARRSAERAKELQDAYLDRLEKADTLRNTREEEGVTRNTETYKFLLGRKQKLYEIIQDASTLPLATKNKHTAEMVKRLAKEKGIKEAFINEHFNPSDRSDISRNLNLLIKQKGITSLDIEELEKRVDALNAQAMMPKAIAAQKAGLELRDLEDEMRAVISKGVDLRNVRAEMPTAAAAPTRPSEIPSDPLDAVRRTLGGGRTATPDPIVIPARAATAKDVPFAERGLFGVTNEGGAARPVLQTIGNLLDVRPGLRSIGEPITDLAGEFGTKAGQLMFGRGPTPSTTVPSSQFIIPMNRSRMPMSDPGFSLTPEAIAERAKSFTAADASKLRQIAKDEGLSDMQIDSMMQRVVQRDPAALEFIQHLSAKLIQMESQPTFRRPYALPQMESQPTIGRKDFYPIYPEFWPEQ